MSAILAVLQVKAIFLSVKVAEPTLPMVYTTADQVDVYLLSQTYTVETKSLLMLVPHLLFKMAIQKEAITNTQ